VGVLRFRPLGTVIVMTVELGLIHRPVGMHLFAIKSVVNDVTSATIFYGVILLRRHSVF